MLTKKPNQMLIKKPNQMLTKKKKLDFDKKKHNYVLTEKKKKRKYFSEHRTYANPAVNPTAQIPTQRGMRKYNRSLPSKKNLRSSIKQKEENRQNNIRIKHINKYKNIIFTA
jgi:hypothetical protein